MVIVTETVQAILCWKGAYTPSGETAAASGGSSVMAAVGGRKLGAVTLLSYATLVWTWV